MVSVMGLLPVGLSSFRDAMDRTVSAQMVQAILNEYQLTSFELLKDAEFFRDTEGQALPDEESANAKYRVEVELKPATLPGREINPDLQ